VDDMYSGNEMVRVGSSDCSVWDWTEGSGRVDWPKKEKGLRRGGWREGRGGGSDGKVEVEEVGVTESGRCFADGVGEPQAVVSSAAPDVSKKSQVCH
jgi:hypothetical protein